MVCGTIPIVLIAMSVILDMSRKRQKGAQNTLEVLEVELARLEDGLEKLIQETRRAREEIKMEIREIRKTFKRSSGRGSKRRFRGLISATRRVSANRRINPFPIKNRQHLQRTNAYLG
jgi:hypothetical protein